MNNSKFNQTQGYPLTTERLQELQTSFKIFNAFGGLAGNFTIVSGCETPVGSNIVQDGFIYLNGELLEFKKASVTPISEVIIVETPVFRNFENAPAKEVYTKRHATLGTAETSWPWSSFKKPIETKEIPNDIVSRLEALEKKNAVFQAGGGMVLWNKPANKIPLGWQEVENWRGRMPIGFDPEQTEFDSVGNFGGNKTKKLEIPEMPAHSHQVYGQDNDAQIKSMNGEVAQLTSNVIRDFVKTSSVGNGVPFSIMNPYRVVLFIEYKG